MRRSIRFNDEEVIYIKENWMSATDEQIAEKLGRSPEAIRRKRDDLGLKKPGGRPTRITKESNIYKNPTVASLATLSKERRLEFYKKSFEKNPRYQQVLLELNEIEMNYYKHKYVEFLDSIDTITINEEDMLHHMLMSDIIIHRIRATMKKESDEWDKKLEGARPPQNLLPELQRAEERYMKYHQSLNVTREQRLKTEKEEKVTIVSIVKTYQDKQAREEAGRHAAMMEYFQDRARGDMLKNKYLLGD